MKKYLLLIFTNVLIFISTNTFAQDNYMIKGYVKGMTNMQIVSDTIPILIENVLHNRIDFEWYVNDNFTFKSSLRNRIVAGNNFAVTNKYSEYLSNDNGKANLTWLWADNNSWAGISQFDRFMIDYSYKNLQITVGRQRINWGQSYVWNPNDLFNTYSYFDFDYEEKPGTDAVRIQYYVGESGKIESSTSINKDDKITSALLYRFNKLGYDFQFLGGILNESDYVVGAGWSGSILGGGFNGELSYYHPTENTANKKGEITATIHYDYSFSNSLNIQFETLYNGFGAEDMNGGILGVTYMDLTPKNLFTTQYALFGSVMYPITPLLNASLSTMYGPQGEFLYVGSSAMYSVSDEMEISVFGQYFSMEKNENVIFNKGTSIFGRIKWAF
ncbi:MAG: hypothetical protein KAG96_07665 [Ichthyobacteriaceae bacterium]|nr:hypothetical protein [Ichthyobacteriaceae bacterium]